MKLPIDDDTLNSWAKLLGLTDEQTEAVVKEIEEKLRLGHAHSPSVLRRRTFEEIVAEAEADDLALMFLVTGLRQLGHHDAADSVELRGLAAYLHARLNDD